MKIYVLLACLGLLFFNSCQKDVLQMPTHEPRLVISGYVYPDSCYVIVSATEKNEPNLFQPLPIISGEQATVVLFEDGMFFDSLRPFSKRIIGSSVADSIRDGFVSMKKAKPGASYRLEVSSPGYPSVSAETSLPLAVPILGADTINTTVELSGSASPGIAFYFTNKTLDFSFADPLNLTNFYMLDSWATVSSAPADSNYRMFLEQSLIFDHRETGEVYDDDYYGNINFKFFSDKYFRNNINHFSYFYGSRSDSLVVLSDIEDLSNDIVNIINNYDSTWISYVPDEVTVRLYTISEEYYKYNQSKLRYMDAEGDPNSEPVIIYSNVQGGYGIFAGISYSEYTYTFANQ